VLAIVRGDEVIFARGFGVADVEKKTPVTPDTPFFIGSATKAFTATLVGMLVDDGRLGWDDPVEKYLPEFKLAVQSKDPNDRATLRDVLSHRTGFTRMSFLEANIGLSSDEIVRRVSVDSGFEKLVWQFPVVVIPVGTPTTPDSIVLRPIDSVDGMTAQSVSMEPAILQDLTSQILQIPGVAAVFYDLTHKPPGTIEWE